MAAISTNTSILSPPSQQRRRCRLVSISSTNLLQFPINNKLLNRLNTAVAPISTAPTHVSATDVQDSAPSSITTNWVEFCDKVSGEWDGFGADFTAEGAAVELPESVVPEAYREWEVKVFDWQTQCPTLAESNNNSPRVLYRNVKLLPTVGCEADAATVYTVEQRIISPPHDSPFAYQSTGCYVAVWPISNTRMELEHCLIDPRNKESRVRIIQVVELLESELKLSSIRVFVEQWYGPFRNGDQLGGCSIRDSAFAATKPLEVSQLSGPWQGVAAIASFQTGHDMIQEISGECASKLIRDEDGLVLLPKQLWSSLTNSADMGETWCEVGWLLDEEGQAITSKCVFSTTTAELKEVAIARETAAPV